MFAFRDQDGNGLEIVQEPSEAPTTREIANDLGSKSPGPVGVVTQTDHVLRVTVQKHVVVVSIRGRVSAPYGWQGSCPGGRQRRTRSARRGKGYPWWPLAGHR